MLKAYLLSFFYILFVSYCIVLAQSTILDILLGGQEMLEFCFYQLSYCYKLQVSEIFANSFNQSSDCKLSA